MKPRFFYNYFLRRLIAVGSLFFMSLTHANDSVKIDLTGYIKKSCGIVDMSGDLDFSNTNYKQIAFELYCNTPFDIALYSQNGGLKNGGNIVRYNVSLDIPELGVKMHGDSKLISKSQLFRSVNKIPFESHAQLNIQLSESLFYAGNYRENLVIEIFPNLLK